MLLSPLSVKAAEYVYDDSEFEEVYSENEVKIYDPLEKYNRKIYKFNDAFDRYFFEHIAQTYRKQVPHKIRISVRNFLVNLTLPISAFNSLLQGKSDNFFATTSTFLINSTIGLGGLFNIAETKKIQYKPEDFGQTLGYYGINSGPYIMLPFLGPSSGRDFSGLVTDLVVDPFQFNSLGVGSNKALFNDNNLFAVNTARAIDEREKLINVISDVRQDSFDSYATFRSMYLQKRQSDIKN